MKQNKKDKFIIKSKNVHGGKYGYSLVEYNNGSVDKVDIICPTHGIFKQLPSSHLNGRGCPKCSGWNKTTQDFIFEAKLIHGNKFDYALSTYNGSLSKIKIICPEHGIFEQQAHH